MNNQGRNFPPPKQPHQSNPHQIPEALALLLAQQSQYVQAHHGQSQQIIQAQAQSIAQLHNANVIANAISSANANANPNIANPNAIAIANANANVNADIAIAMANANANASANADASASVVPSSSTARKSKKSAAKKSTSQKKKKDSNIPEKEQVQEKLVELLPNSVFYTKLLDHEAEIDAAIAKKKIEVQECLRNHANVQKILRVYVFNTFANQAKPGFLRDKKSDDVVEEEPSWSLKITGRIVEENGDDEGQIKNPKFSNFFKRIFIYLDKNLYPDDHVIVWDSDYSVTPNDGFEVKRKGDKEFTAKIKVEINNTPEKFILSKPLSEILGLEFETHSRIVSAFYNYVHSKNLLNPNNLWLFKCDTPLKRLFGEQEKILKFEDAIEKLSDHLTRPKPIEFEHRIKLSGDCLEGISCYDIQVDVPFALEKDMETSMDLKDNWVTKGIEAYGKKIHASFEEMNEHRRTRALFLSFSQDPEGFVKAFIDSQSKGMNHNNNNNDGDASGSGNHRAGKEILSDEIFNQPWVKDAVIRYLNKKAASDDANVDRNRRNAARGKAPMK